MASTCEERKSIRTVPCWSASGRWGALSPKQRQLARFVVESGSEAAFHELRRLALRRGSVTPRCRGLHGARFYTGSARVPGGNSGVVQEDISSLRRFPLDRESSGTRSSQGFRAGGGHSQRDAGRRRCAAYEGR